MGLRMRLSSLNFLRHFFVMYYFQNPLQSMLQALNLARAAMINSLIGAIVKIVIILSLRQKKILGLWVLRLE